MHARPPPVGRHDAKAELEGVCQRRDALCAAGVLADDDRFAPIGHIDADPAGEQGLSNEVIHRALEEALHLRGVEVDGHDVGDTGDVEEVGNHAGGDGPAMLLFLGLARVGEVRHDSCSNQQTAVYAQRRAVPVTDFAEPPLQAEIMISSSMTESLILPG